jgi:hypothetical protein
MKRWLLGDPDWVAFPLVSAQGRAVVMPEVDPEEMAAKLEAVAEHAVASVRLRHGL